ncbi:uncharacterized protein B0I36DRAFT_352670 [Microdochium trichocladiopsis]|uniref:Uncharacterized protein n=1 Tax=Microdochium trichocladiopsis TaxID=1682393 RepID=A0A9P8XXL2_9PEZI|nr:uncharacterized protein B0I36DRAFT_352670 [Microdochium trichocladiopsis]KAH7024439.1 hypothetical protein B0I36DRAFT_352670 [Microdochium trichocladiopsis]
MPTSASVTHSISSSGLSALPTATFQPQAMIEELDNIQREFNKIAHLPHAGSSGGAPPLSDAALINQLGTLNTTVSVEAAAQLVDVHVGTISLDVELEICRAVRRVLQAEQRLAVRLENDCTNRHGRIGSSTRLEEVLTYLAAVRAGVERLTKTMGDLGIIPECAENTRLEEANIRETVIGLLIALESLENNVSTAHVDQLALSLNVPGGIKGPVAQAIGKRPNRRRDEDGGLTMRAKGCDDEVYYVPPRLL